MSISEQYMQAEMAHIHASGLFLSDWYVARHPELARPNADPLGYFCKVGWRQGDQPNPYFDPGHYLAVNQDVGRAGLNPLLHYITHGDKEGRDPCAFFHVSWYRQEYQVAPKENGLRHFLDRRFSGQVAPVPLFDPVYYFENNPDVATAGSDPFEHFLAFGAAEMRNPSAAFDIQFYTSRYGAVLNGLNPLLHYLANRDSGMFVPMRPEHEKMIPGAVKRATRPSPHFEAFRPMPIQAVRKAKLLAFYLPQFHTVPENNVWWGDGFTEWTNLVRSVPRFAGHLQPRVPRDLGFYSLDDPKTLHRQIEFAKGGGVSGFIYYFYWFNRKRMLDAPLNAMLADDTADFPFCVTWANENWTRRWDGSEREVLMAQEYRESDDADLIDCFANLFADRRYIRIDGRPLLIIYRAALIPDAARRIAFWRAMFQARHNEAPLILMVQSLEDYDPTPYGLDGAIEFPPHKIADRAIPINDRLDLFDAEFTARVYEYSDITEASLAVPDPAYPLIKTIAPGWDNDPRREGKGLVLHAASPEKYQNWLEALVKKANALPFFGEPIICVNAWNEWAEGAFLEPDVHFGAAFLNATGRAICEKFADSKLSLLLVGHDGQPHGAQMLLLHLARHYKRVCGIDVHILLLGPGPLVPAYQKAGTLALSNDKALIGNLLTHYARIGIRSAIVNSVASARLVPELVEHGMEVTLLVHEMPKLMAEHNLQMQAKLGASAAKNIVFAGEYPRRRFYETLNIEAGSAIILPQGNYQKISFSKTARDEVRARLGIDDKSFLVLAVGFGDIRKGFDLFIQMARKIAAVRSDVYFMWVGDVQPTLRAHLSDEINAAQQTGRFFLVNFTDRVAAYFAAADIFALTSREDPFPTVVIEAVSAGLPVVAFENSGAVPEMIERHKAGLVAQFGNLDDFCEKLLFLMQHDTLQADRFRLSSLCADQFSHAQYTQKLLLTACPDLKNVSVCILNYNYAQFLKPRLESVFAQTYPVMEILFFDDGSADGSRELAEASAREHDRELSVIANLQNAGSGFAQWQRAVEAAHGEYVWIAEADDSCAPNFLAGVISTMAGNTGILLGFSDSQMIDGAGQEVSPDYKSHYRDADAGMLAHSGVFDAAQFARQCLSVQNLIYNVSGVVWRRDALLEALGCIGNNLAEWQVAGDWRVYLELLGRQSGLVAYVAEPLNQHRRHGNSASQSLNHDRHLQEIKAMQDIAAGFCGLDDAAQARQTDYYEKVKSQFAAMKTEKSQQVKSNVAARYRIARKL